MYAGSKYGFHEMERCRKVRSFPVLERRSDICLLWGAAYLAAQEKSPIFLVFAIEKLFYVVRWLQWMRENDGMGEIKKAFRSNDKFKILAPLFHSTYGTGDFLFGVLFFLTWLGAM